MLNQLKLSLSANNAENAVHNTEKFTYLCREFYSWVFSYAYAVESQRHLSVTLMLSACYCLMCAVNSDTCRSSSGAEYYKGFLIIMEVASFILLSNPLLTHCENYAICHCN